MAKRIATAVACAGLVLAGCGGDESQGVDTQQVRSVVTQFAESNGPQACALLSPDALVDIYGGFSKPVDQARASCIRRSAKFRGQPVKITTVNIVDHDTVKVGALNPKGDVTYSVTLRRFGPAWRIDEITQSKTE